MSTPFMIQSANGVLTMDIEGAVYAEGTAILGYYLPSRSPGAPIQPDQSWQQVADPLGSSHFLLVSGACDLCIGIGANVSPGADTTDDATDRGAALTLQVQEPVNNHYQLWNVQNAAAQFTAGMGTITTTASPGIAAQNYAPNPFGLGTAENSNMPYDFVQVGSSRLIAQPFGLPPVPVVPPVHSGLGGERGYGAVIIEEPGGIVEIFPGDAPGPVIVFDDDPASPGYDDRR